MKIKVYILTYKNSHDLNSGLSYFFQSNAATQEKHSIELTVINNHSSFDMADDFKPYVSVLHNVLQADFSTGHNSRNWNQALVLGFQDLNNPACDVVITAHDDTWWEKDWLEKVEEAFGMGYTYIACGLGDNIQIWKPEGLKRIGLWDERFSVLCMAEHDYFYRAAWLNGEKSSVNDIWHGRQVSGKHFTHYAWNTLPFGTSIIQRPPVNSQRQTQMNDREGVRHLGREFFHHKWGVYAEQNGVTEMLEKKLEPLVSTYMFYPYFEKNIETLSEQKYLWVPPYKWG